MEEKTNRWLTEKDVSKMLNISVSLLQKHRFRRKGIPYTKFGRSVRYLEQDVIDFMCNSKITV